MTTDGLHFCEGYRVGVYHVNPENHYTDWKANCSFHGNTGSRLDIWQTAQANPTSSCRVNMGDSIGVATLIGFSTGKHLHYSVFVDQNNDAAFTKGQPSDNGFNERIDPAINIDVHMQPGRTR